MLNTLFWATLNKERLCVLTADGYQWPTVHVHVHVGRRTRAFGFSSFHTTFRVPPAQVVRGRFFGAHDVAVVARPRVMAQAHRRTVAVVFTGA